MDNPIMSRARILRIYDTARQSLDVLASIEHTASNLDLDPVLVESVVQGREAVRLVGEVAPC